MQHDPPAPPHLHTPDRPPEHQHLPTRMLLVTVVAGNLPPQPPLHLPHRRRTMTFNEGDEVYLVGGGWSRSLSRAVIQRVTKTQAITKSGHRFNRTTGRMVAGSEWSSAHIEHPTPALHQQYREQQARGVLRALAAAAQKGDAENVRSLYAQWDHLSSLDTGGER